jgi:hypothetical protein
MAMRGRRGAGLPHARVQAEIGGQLAAIAEAADVRLSDVLCVRPGRLV